MASVARTVAGAVRRSFSTSPAAFGTAAPAEFNSLDAYMSSLAPHAPLPPGFRVGTHSFTFTPAELATKTARMTLTLLACDKPTTSFAAMFTTNAYPGAPVLIGRSRLTQPAVQAVLVNNKISNVCAPGGVEDSERLCLEAGRLLGCDATAIIPSSTGVIG